MVLNDFNIQAKLYFFFLFGCISESNFPLQTFSKRQIEESISFNQVI